MLVIVTAIIFTLLGLREIVPTTQLQEALIVLTLLTLAAGTPLAALLDLKILRAVADES